MASPSCKCPWWLWGPITWYSVDWEVIYTRLKGGRPWGPAVVVFVVAEEYTVRESLHRAGVYRPGSSSKEARQPAKPDVFIPSCLRESRKEPGSIRYTEFRLKSAWEGGRNYELTFVRHSKLRSEVKEGIWTGCVVVFLWKPWGFASPAILIHLGSILSFQGKRWPGGVLISMHTFNSSAKREAGNRPNLTRGVRRSSDSK